MRSVIAQEAAITLASAASGAVLAGCAGALLGDSWIVLAAWAALGAFVAVVSVQGALLIDALAAPTETETDAESGEAGK